MLFIKAKLRMVGLVSLFLLLLLPIGGSFDLGPVSLDLGPIRQKAKKNNVTSLLVFGDSFVDPGNNNHLNTTFKCNFPPYGIDFPTHQPTGRCTNGRLPTDILASYLGISDLIPAFLDPSLKKEQLIHGVSFASAYSGYDELTANITNVLSISKQLEYFLQYKMRLSELIGKQEAEAKISNAVFVISAGTSDFLQNYSIKPQRSNQYNVEEYINFLMSQFSFYIREMHRYGGRKFAVIGVPPFGCLPLLRTQCGENDTCLPDFNQVAFFFNTRLQSTLLDLNFTTGLLTAFVDSYFLFGARNVNDFVGVINPQNCQTVAVECDQFYELRLACNVFWDGMNPIELAYQYILYTAMESIEVPRLI